jgi:murein DD-endopeptidase MepM/ murein hydrolase activator NlpD
MKLLLCSLVIAALPLRHLSPTSPFGFRIHPVTGKYSFHAGVDLRAHNDTVFAVLPGTVEAEGFDPFLGIYVRLRNGDFQTIYGHLSRLFVFKGDTVRSETELGITGSTGRVTGEHLHFEVKFHGKPIDPMAFLMALYKSINNNLIIK